MAPDYEAQLIDLVETIEVPKVRLHPDTIPAATEALYEVNEKYGPESDRPRAHHNADHGVDHIRRSVQLINITHPFMKTRHQARCFDLMFRAGAYHDIILELGPGANEIASADVAIKQVEKTDSSLNNKTFKGRLGGIVIGTTADVLPSGKVIQPKLLTGPHDPLILISAYSDIQGIAMEDSTRMYGDATSIALERHNNNPTDEQYVEVLVKQPVMMKENISDRVIVPQLEYYFPERSKEVYDELRAVFRTDMINTYDAAVRWSDRPELQYAALQVVRALDLGTYKATSAGKLIGKAINSLHRD